MSFCSMSFRFLMRIIPADSRVRLVSRTGAAEQPGRGCGYFRLPAVMVILCTTVSAALASETESPTAELTDDEQHAMAAISEGRVTTAVSFLASDEMAGRDTPSIQLNIASAYVAAAFRGAGLSGGGPDGSFYQTTEMIQVFPDSAGAT